ncbi:hypothetical protein [Pseudooceanicola algae]|uniref:Uncharacterized protein n=1 Tax=Pseudooceanicola algae TaxID=1537215 RepID=A0A418SDB6_9RHOB|nr:hypothetical protein [Pseudooceanicola algae]QPM89377.1 hypothetical protein PSAL_005930 [Pseudooceanicola algae]
MDVKLQTILAGPEGCADAGTVMTVSDVVGRRLIAAGSATEYRRPVRETAMIDPRALEEEERRRSEEAARSEAEAEQKRKGAEAVGAALKDLDPSEDDDWTSAGKPAMDRIKDLTGSTTLTRADVEALFPAFKRPSSEAPPPAALNAVASKPASAASGARSNRP